MFVLMQPSTPEGSLALHLATSSPSNGRLRYDDERRL